MTLDGIGITCRAIRVVEDRIVTTSVGDVDAEPGDWVVTLPDDSTVVMTDEDYQLFSNDATVITSEPDDPALREPEPDMDVVPDRDMATDVDYDIDPLVDVVTDDAPQVDEHPVMPQPDTDTDDGEGRFGAIRQRLRRWQSKSKSHEPRAPRTSLSARFGTMIASIDAPVPIDDDEDVPLGVESPEGDRTSRADRKPVVSTLIGKLHRDRGPQMSIPSVVPPPVNQVPVIGGDDDAQPLSIPAPAREKPERKARGSIFSRLVGIVTQKRQDPEPRRLRSRRSHRATVSTRTAGQRSTTPAKKADRSSQGAKPPLGSAKRARGSRPVPPSRSTSTRNGQKPVKIMRGIDPSPESSYRPQIDLAGPRIPGMKRKIVVGFKRPSYDYRPVEYI